MQQRRLVRILRPFQEFLASQIASGVILLVCALLAIVGANLEGGAESHHHLMSLPVTFAVSDWQLSKGLEHWINDGLMAIFFLVVGIEIKRELVHGELASLKQALLPIFGALGGMIVPALIYMALNSQNPEASHGWGIPMATDIAFAMACAAVLGKRVPQSLVVFLTALAIVDDLGAVLVIALFYTASIDMGMLAGAGAVTLLLVLLNYFDVRRSFPYLLLGAVLWYLVLKSGIHATIAGVVLGFTIPSGNRSSLPEFLEQVEGLVQQTRQDLERATDDDTRQSLKENALLTLEELGEDTESPAHKLAQTLQPWVSYLIMPVFALANTALVLSAASFMEALGSPVTQGVALGLLFGKTIGVFGASYLAIRMGLAARPAQSSTLQLLGFSILAGIGFTMSLFVNNLAFSDIHHMDLARQGILLGSVASAVLGFIVLFWAGRQRAALSDVAQPLD